MTPQERKTYFLYGEGRALDVLCLGNLILGSYSNPTIATNYTHRQLSPGELRQHASSTDFKDRVIHAKYKPGYGTHLDGAQLVDFDVSWNATEETVLTARVGTRVELKDPADFLNTQVIQGGGTAEAKLKLWLSAANSDYMLRMKWLRKPSIWMCTGLYLLEDTRMFTVSSKKLNTSVGVSAVTISALAGVPLGGSIKISPDMSLKMEAVYQERLVWAAQYRKIDAKYIRLRDGEVPMLPNILSLYQDVTSEGSLRDEFNEPNAVELVVSAENDDNSQDIQEDQVSEKVYYERLAEAVIELEEWL